MLIDFHSLHWDNVDSRMLFAHKKVMKHFDIPMVYHNINGANHGVWMDTVVENSTADVVVFFEPDCIPIDESRVVKCIQYAYKNSFVGIAQVSNHIPPRSHIYAAPGFYCINRKIYDQLGRPSFTETRRSDTAEEISYIAEQHGIRYRALMPIAFEHEPTEGLWPLSNLGYYGIGTVFDNTVYHLYQSRLSQNIDLFIKRCEQVIQGCFTTDGFIPSTIINYKGNIVR